MTRPPSPPPPPCSSPSNGGVETRVKCCRANREGGGRQTVAKVSLIRRQFKAFKHLHDNTQGPATAIYIRYIYIYDIYLVGFLFNQAGQANQAQTRYSVHKSTSAPEPPEIHINAMLRSTRLGVTLLPPLSAV